jgi:DNA-binding GntR family transcriptional regulator
VKNNKNYNKIDIQRLSDKAYEAIKARIINLSLKPGEQLLEQQLAHELGVSKSPIRDAFHRLERERLVYMIPFKGWYVYPVSMEEFREIHQVREALEIYCLRNGLSSFTQEEINEFKKLMGSAKKKLDRGNNSAAYNAHRLFHSLIITKLKNKLIEDIYSNISDKLNRYLSISVKYVPSRVRLANEEHFSLLEAIEKKDVPLSVERLKLHLSNLLEDYLNCDEIKRLQLSSFNNGSPDMGAKPG